MNVAIIHSRQKAAVEGAALVQTYLTKKGVATHAFDSRFPYTPEVIPDLIIALGGDGTLLRAFHLFKHSPAPLMGINFGKMGFLSGATSRDLPHAIDYALTKDAHRETRTLLEVSVNVEGDKELLCERALNEVVIGRRQSARIIETSLSINGHDIYTLRGDGLIVATATGSTAYALSAGGPVVSPGYDGMVIVPLASHTLVQRALVTAPDDEVAITLPALSVTDTLLSVDGREFDLGKEAVKSIQVKPSSQALELIKLDSRLFYDTVAQNFFSGE